MASSASLHDLAKETERLLHHLHASAPPAPSAEDTPRSPRRKKRAGMYSSRNTTAFHPPPKIIPQQFPPVLPIPLPLTMAYLLAYQTQCDRSPFLSTSVPLILDTGASISITNSPHDFVGPIKPIQNTTVQGIAAGISVHGIGTVRYIVRDTMGAPYQLTIPGVLYAPACPSRLLCPRQLLSCPHSPTDNMTINAQGILLTFAGRTVLAEYDTRTNLPTLHTLSSITSCHSAHISAVTPTGSPNLTTSQQIKLKWHCRLNHCNFNHVTQLMRSGAIKVPPSVINAPTPLCLACQLGKARRRAHTGVHRPIDKHHTKPGDGISADQMEAGYPGLLPTTKGSPTKARYHYCNFWIDHHSRLVYVTMHQKKDLSSLLQSKQEFEQFCSRHGVHIKFIRADNGIYASAAFRTTCSANDQDLTMCAVGSHWQNGIAERTIGKIQATARTILLHAMHHWPASINESFWPFAVHHAVNLHNIAPSKHHIRSPWELFTNTPPPRSLTDYKVFGCPTYILNKDAQDNPSAVKKWSERAWQGIYLGHSCQHAHNVALIYNIDTTHVTPQFHAVFDESFSTVSGNSSVSLDDQRHTLPH
jgi:hypothetical protein